MIILANTCLATDIIYQYIHLINNYILIDIYHHSSLGVLIYHGFLSILQYNFYYNWLK